MHGISTFLFLLVTLDIKAKNVLVSVKIVMQQIYLLNSDVCLQSVY